MFNQLKEIISNQFGVPIEELTEDTQIDQDLNADSIDIVEVIMTIEKAYNIVIQQSEYQDKTTVGSLFMLIKSKINQ